jgi:hypothetical protein
MPREGRRFWLRPVARTRGGAIYVGAALLVLFGLACGRPLPKDEPVATAPVETGAFGDTTGPAAEGAVTVVGTGAPHRYAEKLAAALQVADPTAAIEVKNAEPDFAALCAGKVDVVAASGEADRDVCGGKDAVVGFHVADAAGQPIVLYVNREAILRFEVEGLLQYAVDNGETLPQEAGAVPLSLDALQETQTKLEQVVAGVG